MRMAKRSVVTWLIGVIALLFGLLTIKSGGSVLFLDGIARQQAGNYVPFVLWFNFLAGFAYITAAVGLVLQRRWAARLSLMILISILFVFMLFGLHILKGGAYEVRTVAAMSLRTTVWGIIVIYAWRYMKQPVN